MSNSSHAQGALKLEWRALMGIVLLRCALYSQSMDSAASKLSIATLTSPMQGLQLKQLLGTGSFGSVYAGHW